MREKTTPTSTEWTEIGTIGIDAGMCWIGDPCYLRGDDNGHAEGSPAGPWMEFINWIGDDLTKQHPLGCVVSTGHGDGAYPVEVRYDARGAIAEVRVRFIE